MVPEGWHMEMLKNIVDGSIKNGYSPNAAEKNTGHWVLGLGALGDNGLIASEIKPVEATQKVLNSRLHPGDFLISRSNTPDKVGRSILFKGEIDNCSYPDLMMRFRVNESLVDTGFIAAKLKSFLVRGYFKNCAAGSSKTMVKINKPIVEKTPLLLPPLQEQKKIACILSSWDKAIETIEKLIENSKAQKKALMQQLLTGKRRLPRFEKEWKNTPLEKLIIESRIPGTTGDIAQKITIKLYGQGVVPKNEKRLGSQSTKYYKRKAGQFIYSKLDFLNGAFGIIPKKLNGFESTLDLPAFDFKTGVEPVWFINFVSREAFYSANLSLANGGRKARRVNPKDLLNLKVLLPSYPEQQEIASLLTTADKEIATLQQKLNCLKQEKNALMQQLLTGKRRVKVDTDG